MAGEIALGIIFAFLFLYLAIPLITWVFVIAAGIVVSIFCFVVELFSGGSK